MRPVFSETCSRCKCSEWMHILCAIQPQHNQRLCTLLVCVCVCVCVCVAVGVCVCVAVGVCGCVCSWLCVAVCVAGCVWLCVWLAVCVASCVVGMSVCVCGFIVNSLVSMPECLPRSVCYCYFIIVLGLWSCCFVYLFVFVN